MKIPKRFKQFGQVVKVKYGKRLHYEENLSGMMEYRKDHITIQENTKTFPMNKKRAGQIFCHEFVHCLFHAARGALTTEQKTILNNEDFVDLVGSLLHQALDTMEY